MNIYDKALQYISKYINKKNILTPLTFHNETQEIFDSWKNEFANIGTSNSLGQYNEFILKRLSYEDCSKISLDTLINKSITTLSYDIISHGYNIVLIHKDINYASMIKERLQEKIKYFNLDTIIQQLAMSSFRFGGAFLYFDIDNVYDNPITNDYECASIRSLNNFIVVEPSSVSAGVVNTNNPLSRTYMNPSQWYVSSCGFVDSTRLMPLSFYDVPNIIKPLFNYLGVSLTQLMQDYTQNADTIRQAISELILRFRTDYIKTQSENIGDEEYLSRIKFNNATKNNFSTLLLSENEELQQITTSISGLDNIASQAYELVVASSGIPATRLMGISPRGFNATGESDLQHYYELISQHQSKIKPLIIECIKKILAFDLKVFDNLYIDIEFKSINYQSEKEKIEVNNLKADYLTKLTQNNIITEQEALESIQNNDVGLLNINDKQRQINANLDLESLIA